MPFENRMDVINILQEMMRGNQMNKEAVLKKIIHIYDHYDKEIKFTNEQFCSFGENGVLCRLFTNGGCLSSGELAQSLGLTSGRIANILKSLEQKGLVHRERAADDRRHVTAILTDLGKDKINDLFRENDKIIMKVIENIDLQELWEALTIFEKMMGNIKRYFEEN